MRCYESLKVVFYVDSNQCMSTMRLIFGPFGLPKCVYVCACMLVCVCVCMYVCVCVFVCVCLYVFVCVWQTLTNATELPWKAGHGGLRGGVQGRLLDGGPGSFGSRQWWVAPSGIPLTSQSFVSIPLSGRDRFTNSHWLFVLTLIPLPEGWRGLLCCISTIPIMPGCVCVYQKPNATHWLGFTCTTTVHYI